ncbi:MAG TPA: hypothetical protein GXX54_08380 [Clostridiales bacterium]|nr:hypothetical protein [Clostridiales bacterium]
MNTSHRFLSLIALLAVLTLLFTGCSLVFPSMDESKGGDNKGSGIDYSKEYEGKWCYQRLPNNLKIDYGDIYAAVRDSFGKDERITISDTGVGTQRDYYGIRVELSKPLKSKSEAELLYTSFLWDNPQFFFIGNTYSYEGYRIGKSDYYNVFYLVYTMSASERLFASQRLEEAILQLERELSGINPSNQFEIELILHDRLLQICSYEDRASSVEDPAALYPTAFTAYGAIVEGKAVCEGYSRAMQLLLHRSGIECTLVSGKDQNNVDHMWNLVTIEGYNYHLDPTWNDAGDRINHSYFNLTTSEILKSHQIDSDNIGIDTCTSHDANYYIRKGRMLSTFKRDDIARIIAQAVINGENIIDLRFTESTFPGARLFINNRNLLTQKVNSYLQDHGLTMWDYDDYNVNEIYCTLTLYRQ